MFFLALLIITYFTYFYLSMPSFTGFYLVLLGFYEFKPSFT